MSERDKKAKSFSLGGHVPSRAKQLKLKKEVEQMEVAKVYEEFENSFSKPDVGPDFVHGDVVNPGANVEVPKPGTIYQPFRKQLELLRKKEPPKEPKREKTAFITPRAKGEKKKSTLEMLKDEIKNDQEEREERHRMKKSLRMQGLEVEDRPMGPGSHDTGDPNTTNIYLAKLHPDLSEQELCELFGQYGPLASVKIMRPRHEEEKIKYSKNIGFVAYMCRKDAERAMDYVNGQDVRGFEMKMGWGKSVPIPAFPIFIPPALVEMMKPPPPSGLPFNAQRLKKRTPYQEEKGEEQVDLKDTVVKVVIPTDRDLVKRIHRVIEFVVREGPLFEAMLMTKETGNSKFSFLFENQSHPHVYYRWKLFSILHGEQPSYWQEKEFVMFEGGSLWKPPLLNPYLRGMPEELIQKSQKEEDKDNLSDAKRDELEELLRNATPERQHIKELMLFCIEHSDAASEIVECISDSLSLLETPLFRKISRLYLVSDILHNCTVKVKNVSFYRNILEEKLPVIFRHLHLSFKAIEGRIRAEQFKTRVLNCLNSWKDVSIFSNKVISRLQTIFFTGEEEEPAKKATTEEKEIYSEDLDGVPIDEDLDGVPLNEDLDGTPLEASVSKFVPSKWETIDSETVQTPSKWDVLDQQDESNIDGDPMEEEEPVEDDRKATPNPTLAELKNLDDDRRNKLRDIEVKVMKYQDDLESGRKSSKSSGSLADQVEDFRTRLMKRENILPEGKSPRPLDSEDGRSRRQSPEYRKRSRSKSPKFHRKKHRRSRSRSPRRHRSRSSSSSPPRRYNSKSKK